MSENVVLLGYHVEKLVEDPNKKYCPAYLLTGPRGAQYRLIRNLCNHDLLFADNARTGNVISIKGYSWFTDRNGYLTPVH